MLQLRLEADHVVERAKRIVLPKLHDRVGLDGRVVRVGQAHRLHRPVPQRLRAALGHDLDRQAAVEIGRAFPFLEFGLLAVEQRLDEGLILGLVHRAVDVVLAGAARPDLVVARLEPADIHVDRIEMDDRRDGVEEGERVGAGFLCDCVSQRRRRQRAGGDDRLVPICRRQARNFLARDRDQGMRFEPCGDGGRKAVAVDGQRAAGRHLVGVAGRHDQRAGQPHLGMQQPDGVVLGVVGAERVGTDEFGKAVGLVRVGAAHRAHFVQDNRNAGLGRLPCCFRTGEAAADDVDWLHVHGRRNNALTRPMQLRTISGGAGLGVADCVRFRAELPVSPVSVQPACLLRSPLSSASRPLHRLPPLRLPKSFASATAMAAALNRSWCWGLATDSGSSRS